MLTRLIVRNVVLIDRLDLVFRKGLTVMTGETGAGKSILLDSLGLALGSRADFDLVGGNGKRAEVTACFNVPRKHPVAALLEEAGIERGDELILRRQLQGGKSPALVNDIPVSAGLLRRIGDSLVEIQGQFEGRGLLDIATHRTLLDRYAGTVEAAGAVATAWREWQEARERHQAARKTLEEARAEEDWLRDAVAQLDELSPEEGEEERLAGERALLANAAKIAEALGTVDQAVAGDNGAASMVTSAAKGLDRMADTGGELLEPVQAALARVEIELEETANCLRAARDKLDGDPGRLDFIEDRLHGLKEQARKHRVTVDELPALRERLSGKLNGLDDQSGELAALMKAEGEAADAYAGLAGELGERRRAAAAELDAKVMAELPDLKLDRARFTTVVEPLGEEQWGPSGMDQVRFEASTNPGMKSAPIDKVASGGELARFLLALKVVLADTSAPMTLIFDEVDSGVGGAVAAAVGNRLSRLGEAMQCLVITHSPQVASRGRYHYRVTKDGDGGSVASTAKPLKSDSRVEEISRMLSGKTVTPEARAAALRLLQQD